MSYGFEFYDASGNVTLRMTEAMARIIYEQRFAANFSGTISVPEFDSDVGMFYVAPRVRVIGNNPPYSDLMFHPYATPSLSWDNDTKVMTIAPASFPAGFPMAGQRPGYWLIFMGLHKRFEVT